MASATDSAHNVGRNFVDMSVTITTQEQPLSVARIRAGESLLELTVEKGKPIFIVGRNGVGKSAFLQGLLRQLSQVIYMPGSRPVFFENESLSLTAATRAGLVGSLPSWDNSPDSRWRATGGISKNEKAIFDLQNAEIQFKVAAANEIADAGRESNAIERLQSKSSPIDRINRLLEQASLPIQMTLADGHLRAVQNGDVYSHARMSDGERSALIFAAEVVAAKRGTVFVIDEPELHLHPSISVPLIRALIAERNDCGFVVSTHELELATCIASAKVLVVRGCQWINNNSVERWDVDYLQDTSSIPETTRRDVLGSRKRILFIEGSSASLDQPLYALLFPEASVSHREGCREVIKAVEGLRSTEHLHRVKAFGLIDHDGMSNEQVLQFQQKGVYPLPVFSVESLYYSDIVLRAVASKHAETIGGSAEELLLKVRSNGVIALSTKGTAEQLASKIARRRLRDKLVSAIPTQEEVRNNGVEPLTVSLVSTYPAELECFNKLLSDQDLEGLIARYPVRESPLLNSIAKSLGLLNSGEYEKAALTRIASDENLRRQLRELLGKLANDLRAD